ncbi:unnamed protein product [Phytophthora fragariaefolia]|uniref:Unnamed protein product n=1 Tax=Phytophthora fragariaefolia TaxID=1490495 RepID=A0A9W6TSK7_9STRA|nr:unnamed protein product [Phytophthora fragariaefolia]
MPRGAGTGLSSLPSSFSSSEHKSDSSSANSQVLLPQPSSAVPPATADQVIELSVSSEELANWRRRHQQAQTGPMPWPGRTRSVLRRYSPLVPPAALLIALVVLLVQDLVKAHNNADSSDLPDTATMSWNACELDNAIADVYNLSAQCATVTLPLCYQEICEVEDDNATINVSLKRIPAIGSSGASAQTVWYLPDRPDVQTREEAELQMTLLYEELRGDVDIYTMYLRGSGESTSLTCNTSSGSPLQTAIFERNDGVVNADDVQTCSDRLHELGYTDLRAFSLASASRDVEEVITQFQSDSHCVIYALGYGTLVAQQLMLRGVSQIVGYALDGALGRSADTTSSTSLPSQAAGSTFYQVSRSDEAFGEVATDFLAWCQADRDCSTMFSDASNTTTLSTTILEVYTRLDADNASLCAMILVDANTSGSINSATPPSFLLRQLLGLMMKSTNLWPFIAVVVFRFHRCGSEDIVVLTAFANATFKSNDDDDTPDLLYAVQAFNELWEVPTPDQTELTKRFTDATVSSGQVYTQLQSYCLFTGENSSAACTSTLTSASSRPSIGGLLSYSISSTNTSVTAIPPGSSVLMLSGGLDTISPPKYAKALFDALHTNEKAMLVAPNGTHGVVQNALLANGRACARQILASYVRGSGNLSAYDASCMADLPTPSLAVSSASSLLVLGVADAYNGILVSTNSSTGSSSGDRDIGSSGSSESAGSSGSAFDDLNRRVSALERSRDRYKVALIVVASVFGAFVLGSIMILVYRRHRMKQLASEEAMLRRMRGDEENEVELMHSIYLLSSSPSSGRRTEVGLPR